MDVFYRIYANIMALVRSKPLVVITVSLACAVVITYGNSISNGFVWDDHDIIVNNPVNRDLTNVFSLFSSVDSTTAGNQKTYYRPLNRLTYLFDYQMFGLDPAGYHIENVLIHILAVLLLFFAARQLFSKTVPAFVAALLFAVHPVNAEAVNFISARNSLLSLLFVLSTLLAYLRAGITGKIQYSILTGLFFFMGLLCKEPVIMLPVVLLAYELVGNRASTTRIKELAVSFLPFIVPALTYLVLRSHALSSVIGGNQILPGLSERLLSNVYIIPRYALVMLFPIQLNANYSLPQNYLSGEAWLIPVWIVLMAALLFIDKRSAATRFGLLWLAVNFIPISNFVPIPSAPMAERYLYLPAVGLWLIAADQICRWYERTSARRTLTAVVTAFIIAAVVITVHRNSVWCDDVSFFTRMSEANPGSALAHFSLGLAYLEQNAVQQARAEFEKTTAIDPAYFSVLGYLGESYLRTNSLVQAKYYYSREVEVHPNDIKALFNLAVISEKLNEPEMALKYYERFLSLKPQGDVDIIDKVNARIASLRKTIRVK